MRVAVTGDAATAPSSIAELAGSVVVCRLKKANALVALLRAKNRSVLISYLFEFVVLAVVLNRV